MKGQTFGDALLMLDKDGRRQTHISFKTPFSFNLKGKIGLKTKLKSSGMVQYRPGDFTTSK